MSTKSEEAEEREKATSLNYMVKALFPTSHLAPWLGIGNKNEIYARVILRTIGDIQGEIRRQEFMLAHPKRKVAPSSDSSDTRFLKFDLKNLKGSRYIDRDSSAIGSPSMLTTTAFQSKDWEDAKWPGSGAEAGVTIQPKTRSLWQKMTGKGKENEKVGDGGDAMKRNQGPALR